MRIPRAWAKATGEGIRPDGKAISVAVWGFGEDHSSAKSSASQRLQSVLDRIRRGDRFPDKYAYGERPLREEILQTVESATGNDVSAVVTRNVYGVEVLNAARLLFLDVDLGPPNVFQPLLRVFGISKEERALTRLRDVLRTNSDATFRIYRTASGFRAMAIDRDFDPTDGGVQELMQSTRTDPAFARLCMAQRSFRARLTPKPWRCGLWGPPGRHPRLDGEMQQRFAAWLAKYESASMSYATCRYLETVGSGSPKGDKKTLLELHDRATRSSESLPLA